MDHDVDVFEEPLNESEDLRQAGSALEEKFGMAAGQSIVEHVEDQADPEIFLHVYGQSTEANGHRFDRVPSFPCGRARRD